jgi:integrase
MQDIVQAPPAKRTPWNKDKLTGAKPPLRPKDVWSIRTKLQVEGKIRDLALFNLAIDSKLRGCDVVSLKVENIAPGGHAIGRAVVRQKKTGQPVRFELTQQTREAVDDYQTGRTYRLPTDEEWVFAAGDRFTDDAVADGDRRDPAKRWLDQYEMESARDSPDKDVRPVGWFGVNAHGLADMGGNVWEWTETCYRRAMLDGTGAETGAVSVNCGVRVVAGRHRSYMTDFVRDARSGGCAVGVPPANLGFRLVRG